MKYKQLTVLSLFGALAFTAVVPAKTDAALAGGLLRSKPGSAVTTPTLAAEADDLPYANGIYDYSGANYGVKEEILGQLESYVLDNFLGGIPFADNAGNVMYDSRIDLPSETYVPGYGFGVGEATITEEMTPTEEPERKYSMYYHSWQSQDPGTINYWDGQDSVTGDLHALVSSSYWSTRFNDDKTGYEWYPSLATEERPQALNPIVPENEDDFVLATKWRVKVRFDDPEVVYDTLSTKSAVAAFKGQEVALEDYLTPFKSMLDGELFRSTDLGSLTSGFTGVQEYLAEVQAGRSPSWDLVTGIQLNEAEGAIDFEFNSPKTAFYAMYNLSSSLFSPVPQAFIDEVGLANYGKPNIDSILSLGMYTLEEWQNDKQLAFKKNPTYFEADRANHAGYKYTILEDNIIAFQEFLGGKLDSAGIPSIYLKEYEADARTRKTLGDTVWKLQVNATNEERWEELFGVNGSIYPHAAGEYWDLKPVMSNNAFLNGLYFALDRATLAANNGRNPSQAFLSDAYMIDPEGGLSFRASPTGKALLENRSPDTFGYSTEAAATYFNAAMDELVAAGKYEKGTVASPTEIELSLIYQTVSQVNDEGQVVKEQLETAFNSAVEGFKLTITPYATEDWMDAYYKPMQGDFDLAFGSISGNTLDPVSFMDTVMSDNRTGFTLSWGVDTNTPTQKIRFDEKAWSFQSLFEAATSGVVAQQGRAVTLFKLQSVAASPADGTGAFTITATGVYYVGDETIATAEIVGLEVYTDGDTFVPSSEQVTIVYGEDGTFTVTITVPGELGLADDSYLDLTVYFETTVGGGAPSQGNQYLEFASPGLPEEPKPEGGLTPLAITGITVGSVAGVGLIGAGIFFFLKKKKGI